MFFICALCFNVVDTLVARSESSESFKVTQDLRTIQKECVRLIYQTKLCGKSENAISEVGDMAEVYAYSLCYTSLGGEVTNVDVYKNKDAATFYDEKTDPLFYYYSVYKVEHADDFVSTSNSGFAYIDNAVRSCNAEIFVSGGYPLLTEKVSEEVDLFLSQSVKGSDGENIFNTLQTAYARLLSEARADFTENYTPYVTTFSSLSTLRGKLIGYKWTEIVLIYLCVTLLVFSIAPFIFKERVSPLLKLLKAASVTRGGDKTPLWSVILKWAGEFITYFNTVFLIPIILYGKNSVLFLRFTLAGAIPFYVLYILSAVFMIVSVILCAANKRNNCTLSDLISYQLIKDLR